MTDIRECSHVHTCQCHVTWSDITPWHIVWLTVTVKQQPSSVESELCPLLHSASVLRGPRYNKDAYCSSVLNLSKWLCLKSVIRYMYICPYMDGYYINCVGERRKGWSGWPQSAVSVREAQSWERAGGAGGATECRVNRQLTHIMWMSTFENKNPVTLWDYTSPSDKDTVRIRLGDN